MESKRSWFWKMLLEVVLIGLAVFIGIAADQWREDRQRGLDARATLVRLKTEMQNNQRAVAASKDYHVRIQGEIRRYLNVDAKQRKTVELKIDRGIWPVNFEHRAWDLALATQSLADIDQALAIEMSRVYDAQLSYTGLTTGLTNAMYLRPPTENADGFLHSVHVWLGDIVSMDPALLKEYDRVLPLIDAALSH